MFLNTSGGLDLGGPAVLRHDAGRRAAIVATTQTAERAYLARDGAAVVQVEARVGAGARLDWLPQETILFEDCFLDRTTRIDLAPGATCLLCETVVLGRRAMGEDPRVPACATAAWSLWQAEPLWADTLDLDAGGAGRRDATRRAARQRRFAVVALLGAGAEAAADALRALPVTSGVSVAASGWNGRCIVRLMAADGWPLKQNLGRLLAHLTEPAPAARLANARDTRHEPDPARK